MRIVLYTIFVLSGAAGLIYESIWARYLGLFVGHSAYAQILVISIFLGGMALGALLVGSRTTGLRNPLKWYAVVEIIVGAIGIVFHDVYGAVTGFAYATIFPATAGTVWLPITKWVLAGALIAPQSILLGTTFPLMGAGVLRHFPRMPGRTLAVLYFANSLGAAGGVLVAGFYLLAAAGLPGTLLMAAILNLLVGLVAYVVARGGSPEAPQPAPVTEQTPHTRFGDLSTPQLLRLLLIVSFGTAVASFMYEIAWLRMLALVLGSATHSFELMLSAFILGLALGSFWVRSRADGWADPLRALGVVQWVMGLAALATLPLYIASFGWMASLMGAFAKSDGGYLGFTLSRYIICLVVMLPSTFCAGITLPLITRTLVVGGVGEKAIGQVYGINTFGSIVGVALAGVMLMPMIGVRAVLIGAAALDMSLGVAILLVAARKRPVMRWLPAGAAAATVVACVGVAAGLQFDRLMLTSGVFRHGGKPFESEVVYYHDGRTATVSVTAATAQPMYIISTNGKPDGSLPLWWLEPCTATTRRHPLAGDATTQTLAPLIALAHAPRARQVAVIGHGTGMSSHTLLGNPHTETVTTIEIEPSMVEGSRAFYPANGRVFDDPRSRMVIADARSYMATARGGYDLILSEPSNPWVSGVASLFTTEFYGHVARSLSERGVFAQWLHLYELQDGLALSVLAAVYQNFRWFEVFMTAGWDMLVIASNGPQPPIADWSIVQYPGVVEDFCRLTNLTPHALEAARVSHRAALAPLLEGWGQANSDYYPVLDLGAERARYLNGFADGVRSLMTERFDPTAPFFGRRVRPGGADDMAVPIPAVPRVQALALGAALRQPPTAAESLDSLTRPGGLDVAQFRQLQWQGMLRADARPQDWKVWLGSWLAVERDRNRGTAGVLDTQLHAETERYLARHRAPTPVRQAVAYYHALAAWDFERAAPLADSLLPTVLDGDGWVSAKDLLEGGVVAKLRMGDYEDAKRLYDAILAENEAVRTTFRVRLLDAYLTWVHDMETAAANGVRTGG